MGPGTTVRLVEIAEILGVTHQRASVIARGADPLLAVQPEVADRDHAGGFLQRRLGLLDEMRGVPCRSWDL